MAEHLQAVWQQVEAFVWRSWSSDEKKALHKGLCKYGDEWDRVAEEVGSKPKNEVVLAAIKLMLEEPDFLQHCGPELQPRLKKLIDQQRQQQQDALTQQQQQQAQLQRSESCSVDQPVPQHQQRQHSIDLQVAESTNLGSMQILERQLEQWQQQLIRHEQHPLPPLPMQQQRLLGGKRLSDSPDLVIPADVELFDQIRPTKRHQCILPDAVAAAAVAPSILAHQALQPQQQQQIGVPGVLAEAAAVNLSPQAAAVLAAHQELLAATAATQQHIQAQQQQQQILAAAQQQQLIRQQQLLQSLAGDTVLSKTAAEAAQGQVLLQQQLALRRLQQQQQQQTACLVPQALVPTVLSPNAQALPGIAPDAAARTAQTALQAQQLAAAAAAGHQFTTPTPFGSSNPYDATTNNSSLTPGLLSYNRAAAGLHGLTAADLASLASPLNPAAAGLGTTAVPGIATNQSPANLYELLGRTNQITGQGISTAGGAAAPFTAAAAGVARNRSGLAPAPGSLAHGLTAAAAAPQIIQQQQRGVSGTTQGNQGLATPAANLSTLLGSADAAVNPIVAAALAADVPRPVRTTPTVHNCVGPQQQQQELLGWQPLLQEQGMHSTAIPVTAIAAGGLGQAGSSQVPDQALLTHHQQQQQGTQVQMPQYGIQQTLQTSVPPVAIGTASADPNAVLNSLGALGSPSITATATPPTAALAAAAAGGWNSAALTALADRTAAGKGGLVPGSIADNPVKLNPGLQTTGDNISNPLFHGNLKDMNNVTSPRLNMLGISNPYSRFTQLNPVPELSGLADVGRVQSLNPQPVNHCSNALGSSDQGVACDGVPCMNGAADSGTGSSESVDESSPLGSECTPLTSESGGLGEHDEHTAEGYDTDESIES